MGSGTQDIGISVVIPCLNEERTIGACVEAALEGIRNSGMSGEVIVADNGSSDRSRQRAEAAGARIVPVSRRGYGAALQEGFLQARGKLLVMGDADFSYDFREIPAFVREQTRTNADLVIGNRFRGGIEKGAMPWSHRVIGNPLISRTIQVLFGVPVRDCYCGLRMITREAHRQLRLRATGMEYALEMIVEASISGMRFSEAPVKLRVDGRDHSPHLRTLRDGYRSFRFLFQHAPVTFFLAPGFILMTGALVDTMLLTRTELASRMTIVSREAALACGALLVGWVMILLGIIARTFAAGFVAERVDPSLLKLYDKLRLEHGIALSLLGLVFGVGLLVLFPVSHTLSLLGMAILVMSVGTFLGSLVISLIGRAVPDNRMYLSPTPAPASPVRTAMAAADQASGQNETHSIETQLALSHAHNYNAWVFSAIEPALRNARRVLDAGCSTGNITAVAADWLLGQKLPAGEPLIVGIEIMARAVEEFRSQHGNRAEMKVIQGNMLSPPQDLQELAPFDAAFSANVLEHIEDDVEALRAIGRLLIPGGRLGLFVPGGGDFLYGTLDSLDRHFRRYTVPKLRSRLELAGYEVEGVRFVNSAGFFLWYFKGRILRSKQFHIGEVKGFDRMVPFFMKLDQVLGPHFGQSLAAIARWKG